MKKWKILLSIFVLIVAAGGGTLYYFLNVKEYKTKDTQVDKIVKSDYNIKLPDSNRKNEDSTQKDTTEQNKAATTGGQQETATGSTGSGQTGAKAGSAVAAAKISASSILNRYQQVFQELESQATGKIDSLLSYALSEYQAKKQNGDEISYFYFYAKYNGAGKQLEASTDASFNYIYSALVKDLKNNGYSASTAEPIKEHYYTLKKERRASLLKKAMKLF